MLTHHNDLNGRKEIITMSEIDNLVKTLENLKVEKRVLENQKQETLDNLKEVNIATEDPEEIKAILNNLINESSELDKELNELLEDTNSKLLKIQEKVGN